MDRKLRNRLTELIMKIPGIGDSQTRTAFLTDIPNYLSLQRDYFNTSNDITLIINQLEHIQLLDGQQALLIFIENAQQRLSDTMNGQQLQELYNQLETAFQRNTTHSSQGTASSHLNTSASQPALSTQASPASKGASGKFPHGYAVVVGVAAYQDQRLHLSEAVVKDAMSMHTALREANLCGYLNKHVQLRYDAGATAAAIRNDLKWLAEMTAADENATAIFYFSGHGSRIEIDGRVSYFLLPFDCNLDSLNETAISGTELAQLLHAIRSPRLLVLLDSCYSGGMDEIKDPAQAQKLPRYGSEKPYYQLLAQDQGRVIIASSSPTETSRASSALNNSVFTHYLLKGLKGEVAAISPWGDGLIRVFDLFNYVSAQVPQARPQHPVITNSTSQNFPIALYRGGTQEASETKVDKTALRKTIVRLFSLEDLKLLCSDLHETLIQHGIDEPFNLDMLNGAALQSKAQDLIDYCERRGWLTYLLAELRAARPDVAF